MRTSPCSTLVPYTTLFRSVARDRPERILRRAAADRLDRAGPLPRARGRCAAALMAGRVRAAVGDLRLDTAHAHRHPHRLDVRSEEHTSELQSQSKLVCCLL